MTETPHRSAPEDARVRDLLARDDRAAAVETLVAAYGAEVFGLLVSVLDTVADAHHVYAEVLARVTAELDAFDWSCPLRIWFYALARRGLLEHRRHRDLDVTTVERTELSAELLAVVVAVRSKLSEQDRELLVLRIDRGLEWEDLATIELGTGAASADVASEAARVRVRFDDLVAHIRGLTAAELGQR